MRNEVYDVVHALELTSVTVKLMTAYKACSRTCETFRMNATPELAPLMLEALRLPTLAAFVGKINDAVDDFLPDAIRDRHFRWLVGVEDGPVLYIEIQNRALPPLSGREYMDSLFATVEAMAIEAKADEYFMEPRPYSTSPWLYRVWWERVPQPSSPDGVTPLA